MGTRFTPTAHSSPRPRAGGEHRWTDSILGTFPSPEQEQDEPRVGGTGCGEAACAGSTDPGRPDGPPRTPPARSSTQTKILQLSSCPTDGDKGTVLWF